MQIVPFPMRGLPARARHAPDRKAHDLMPARKDSQVVR